MNTKQSIKYSKTINPTSTLIREVMIDEMEAINNYSEDLKRIQSKELFCVIEEILMDEVKHYNWLIEILRQIDGEQGEIYKTISEINIPSFTNDQEKNIINNNDNYSIDDALRKNLMGELDAINEYEERLLKIGNKHIRDVITKIITDEKDHVEILTKAVNI